MNANLNEIGDLELDEIAEREISELAYFGAFELGANPIEAVAMADQAVVNNQSNYEHH